MPTWVAEGLSLLLEAAGKLMMARSNVDRVRAFGQAAVASRAAIEKWKAGP